MIGIPANARRYNYRFSFTLRLREGETLEVIDPSNKRLYVIVDAEIHRRAMRALRKQEDWEAIQEGIAQAERGETMPLEEVDARIRQKFGFPER